MTEMFRGEVEGTVVWPPRGNSVSATIRSSSREGYDITFGEMTAEEKHGWKPGDAAGPVAPRPRLQEIRP